jgi:isoquinoline 1-oxidoreductase subunit beta
MHEMKLNRRDFLKVVGTAGTRLVMGLYLSGCAESDIPAGQSETETLSPSKPINLPSGALELNIYLKIDPNNTVTVTAFRSEMGQGIRTAIAMILAEELDADWNTVVIEQAPADSAYGDQITGGSTSISESYFELRMAGGAIRQMLINAAAQAWEVDPAACTTQPGVVVHPDGNPQFSYGELAGAASEQAIPRMGEYTLKPESEFRLIGSDVHHWDARDIVTGQAIFGMDVVLPEMRYAALERCPVFGGRVTSFDAAAAEALPGVEQILEIKGDVAVVATNTWAALKGREVLEIEWEFGDNASLNSADIRAELAGRAPQIGSAGEGEVEAIYEFPYQAHATMEPMNCTADFKTGRCEVWAPTQNAQDVHRAVQGALGLSRQDVTVHIPLMGGGFGRRLQSDYAVEAALVSQAIGAPVKVVWTRDDDIQHDLYHPLSYQYVSGDPNNIKRPNANSQNGGRYIPTGAWRSVGNHPEAFARECFIDELAAASGRDPLDVRRDIFSGRGLAVIALAAEKAGWGDSLPESWGRGMAYHATFGVTHVAMVAEVEVTEAIRVHRVVVAVDCGTAINPDNIAAQMEGGVAFGLTAALKAGIAIENGRVKESNFHDCPMLQIDEMPVVEVYLIEGTTNPSGIGEMGVPPVAPAVANAIYAATGVRARGLPIKVEDLV